MSRDGTQVGKRRSADGVSGLDRAEEVASEEGDLGTDHLLEPGEEGRVVAAREPQQFTARRATSGLAVRAG